MKYVIITGCSKGLGASIVSAILSETHLGVIGISRSENGLTKQLTATYGSRFEHQIFDLNDVDEISRHVTFWTQNKDIFALINNAAMGTSSVLATMHESEITSAINLNLTSAIFLSKYVSRKMLRNQHGRIINIASVVAHTGYNGLAVYGATKSAILGLTKSLARELGGFQITVNSISPGFMETDMTKSIESKLAQIRRRSPLNQLTSMSAVAAHVLFLLGDDAATVTGHDFIMDAGNSC